MSTAKRIVMLSIADFNYLPPANNEGLALSKNGYHVDVYTLRNKQELRNENRASNYEIHRIFLLTRFLPKRHFFWAIKYIELVFRFFIQEGKRKADVYVAHNFDALIPIYAIAKIKKVKIVYHAHELYTETFNLPFRSFWKWLEKKLLNHINAIITPNEERAEIFHSEYGSKEKPFVIMNCPIYTPPFESNALQNFLKEQGVSNQFIVIYQGRLTADNGIEEMITAAQYFIPGICLILIGPVSAEFSTIIGSKLKQLNLANRVFIHKPVSYRDLPTFTASANVGVVLYRNKDRNYYYCAPNKLFEYLMVGLPVVTSNFPGLRKLVELNHCGMIVDQNDPLKISQAINYLCRNPSIYKKMKDNSFTAAKKYNWDIESEKLIYIYKKVLGEEE